MSYIYDIVLNFNRVYYDFYEWQDEDKIENIKRIPLFRLNNIDYLSLKHDDIVFKKEFEDVIKNCNNSKSNSYYFLVSDGREVMGVSIDDKGYLKGRSSLLFDEEEEVLDEVDDLSEYVIGYDVIRHVDDKGIVSRVVRNKKSYLLDFFNSNNKIDVYRYIYYDFYEIEETDVRKIKGMLLNILNGEWNNDCEKLYNCIRLLNEVRQ